MSNTKKERVKKWKESASKESLQTLPADQPSQAVAEMVDLQAKNNVTITDSTYYCITQSTLPGNISVSNLQVGMEMSGNRFIPRWKRNSEVRFATFANGYTTSDQAQYTASMLKKATDVTSDGAKNLAPRPAVHGMNAWEEIDIPIAGKQFKIVAVPTKHVPGDECTGFIVTGEDFGHGREGLPNAIYFTGDTVYIDELDSIANRYHVCAAVMNLGNAHVPTSSDPDSPRMQITMGGKDGAKLFRALKADVLVPMHYESWGHFTQFGKELRQAFEEEGISDKICWLKGGEKVSVL